MGISGRTPEEESIARRIEEQKNLQKRKDQESKTEVKKIVTLWTPVFQQYVATMAKKLGTQFRVGWMRPPWEGCELVYEWVFIFAVGNNDVANINFHFNHNDPYIVITCGDKGESYQISSRNDLEALTPTLFEKLYKEVINAQR